MGFGMLTGVILGIPRGQTSAKRIYEVLDMPLSVKEASAGTAANHPQTPTAALSFEQVDFRYQGAAKKTLEDISFTVNAGQTLAIIGSTGDGKSSLVNLISRLYDVESGRITINGTDIRGMEQKKLRDMVSLTPQKSTLFFGTIRSNMLEGKQDATDTEIGAALDMAQATEFVHTLPNGIDSAVEKGGGNFSGGQKQRLCIARALLKNALVYIFDDSFSALDFKTDGALRSAMRPKLKDAITIIVAQRIGTIMNADIIAVLDKGRIVGLGSHETLAKTSPVYQQIMDSQWYKEEKAV
jgi:ATP-binding cassette subfamily B protein